MQIIHNHCVLELLKERAIWWEQKRMLFISDLHYGKAAHFRKSGIPIPEPIHEKDLLRLDQLFSKYLPQEVYFLGDLFHSDWNLSWDELMNFLKGYPSINFHLVKGNHDVLPSFRYENSPIQLDHQPVFIDSLVLSHEPLESIEEGFLNLCGHIHPGVRLRGMGRQSLRVPCFYKIENQIILPAFGEFTGLALMQSQSGTEIYGVTPSKVIPILS